MKPTTNVLKTLIAAAASRPVCWAGVAQAQVEQYLVVAAGNDFPDARVQAVQQAGGQIVKVFPQIGLAVATSADPEFPAKTKSINGIQSVVPDPIVYQADETQSMPVEAATGSGNPVPKAADLTGLQWGLQAIQAQAAWGLGWTGKGVRVAVIDGGIMTTHPDLSPNLNLALSTSVVPGETVEFILGGPAGGFSHATHVAGIIAAANNGFGTTGVAPDAELVAVKIGSDAAGISRTSWMIEGILYAAQIDADVANMSFGQWWAKNDPPGGTALDVALSVATRAIVFAEQQGTLLVAGEGNDGWDWDGAGKYIAFPRDLPGVLGVSATAPLELMGLQFNRVP